MPTADTSIRRWPAVLAARVSHRRLTSRELEVLRMVAKGLGNKEIAAALNIARFTVKLHVSHVLEKLNVKDRTEAATARCSAALFFGIASDYLYESSMWTPTNCIADIYLLS